MEITLNNEHKTITNDSLQSLVNDVIGEKTKGIAIAINETIIPKAQWETTSLKDKDVVLIIKATQGG